MAEDGRAARPEDLFNLYGAGTQAVGRAGEAAGGVFGRRRGLLFIPLRDFVFSGPGAGGWGETCALDRRIVSHIL